MSVGLVTIPNLDAQLADLKQRGLDPAVANICAPSAGTPGAIRGIAGCRHFQRCIFGRKENGGGKGQGKHNVPYFIDARDGLNHATEMFMDCMLFMQLLNPRRVAGMQAIDEGLDGEQIDLKMDEDNPTQFAKTVTMVGFVKIDPLNPLSLYERKGVETPVPKYKFSQEMEHKEISKVREARARRQAKDPNSQAYQEPETEEVLDLTSTEPERNPRATPTKPV